MKDVQIRPATREDAQDIARVLHESFVEYEPLYTPGGFEATTPGSERIMDRMGEGPVWVALLDSAVVGTVAAVTRGEGLYVRGMGVVPQARGRGVGRLLLEAVERFAVEQGHRRMFLSTTPFLDTAIGLYKRAGFRRTHDGPHELHGTPLFTMEKILKPSGEEA